MTIDELSGNEGDVPSRTPQNAVPPGRYSLEHWSRELACTVLNSLSAGIAILDELGVILETNRAWREFGEANGISMSPDTIGVDYLAVCDAAKGADAEEAKAAAAGIRAVVAGEKDEFVLDYPCHSPDEERWCYMRAIRLAGKGVPRVVVSHENITPLKKAQETLLRQGLELERRKQNLEEANTALKVLLRHREGDKRELEETVVTNVKELVKPYLAKLTKTRLDPQQRTYLEICQSRLDEIVSPFLHKLSTRFLHLTPQEIQVAGMIREGRASKDIAAILNVSPNTVDFHRKNVRRKLGLRGQKENLRSFLLSLSK